MYAKAFVIGNVTRDLELRTVGKEDTSVTEMTIAVTDGYGDRENTSFLDVTVWGKQAESCAKYLQKGSKVSAELRFKTDKWEDKDGNNRSKLCFVADSVKFLNTKEENEARAAASDKSEDKPATKKDENGEDIPF